MNVSFSDQQHTIDDIERGTSIAAMTRQGLDDSQPRLATRKSKRLPVQIGTRIVVASSDVGLQLLPSTGAGT